MGSRHEQGKYWLLTIPHASFTPYHVPGCAWLRGQLERGASGYVHWQIFICTDTKRRRRWVKDTFGSSTHCELSRSSSAEDYVWKEDTRVPNTQFEFGSKPIKRNSRSDWESIWELAKTGRFEEVDSNVRVVHYRTLRTIYADYSEPVGMVRTCFVFWGRTGSGKSRRAWTEAGVDAYPKCPMSKFWSGYRGQKNVVLDEFRGGIAISHLLRWLDRYPVHVEIKGSSVPLAAETIWITSNVPPSSWYPDLDGATYLALERRLQIVEFE